MNQGCKKTLAHNQGYEWCGEPTYGHMFSYAICEECGGPYRLRGQYSTETGPRYTHRYSTPEARRVLIENLKLGKNWIPWLYMRPIQ